MGWHLLETLLQQVGEHSSLVGKLWVTATFVFRFVIVASVGDAVYSDEQSDFTCNTNQPGCENVCFNLFSPVSHLRFWAAQIVAVCTPSIVFIVYTAHMLLKIPQESEDLDGGDGLDGLEDEVPPPESQPKSSRKRKAPGRMPSSRSRRSGRPVRPMPEIGFPRGFTNPPAEATEIVEDIGDDIEEDNISERNDSVAPHEEQDHESLTQINRELEMLEKMQKDDEEKIIKKRIQFVYVISLLLRTGFEVAFLWLQYVMYGFAVPELFECERSPCPKIVDCFVSRPKEKTFLLWFMFVVSCICLLLNVVEIHYLGFKKLVKVLCGGSYGDDTNTNTAEFLGSRENDIHASNDSKASSKRRGDTSPSAPPDGDGIFTVINYSEKKNKEERDPIGFDAIGDQPHYPTPGYPFVHRYGMYLNATPPPPQSREPDKYYL